MIFAVFETNFETNPEKVKTKLQKFIKNFK